MSFSHMQLSSSSLSWPVEAVWLTTLVAAASCGEGAGGGCKLRGGEGGAVAAGGEDGVVARLGRKGPPAAHLGATAAGSAARLGATAAGSAAHLGAVAAPYSAAAV